MELNELITLLSTAAALKDKGLHLKGETVGSVNNAAQLLYGATGLFSSVALDNTVISTHVTPMGLGSALPAIPGTIDNPLFPFLTGVSADYGSEPVNKCDDAPKNYMKGGMLTAAWGRISRMTETIEVTELLHELRGVNTNLRLLGNMLGTDTLVGSEFNGDPLSTEVMAQMVGVGVSLERKLAKLLWAGTPTNNTANGGYREFPGLDSQIATGQVDAETGTALPSVDSVIFDFNYNLVDATVLDIVEYIAATEYYLHDLADRTGLSPVQWVIVMRPDLWHELTEVWPCRYMTNGCGFNVASAQVNVNGDAMVQMRDRMRTGMNLTVNGRTLPVIVDDGIVEKNNQTNAQIPAGHYASSIYFVPLTMRGGFRTTYWEFIDYRRIRTKLAPMGVGASKLPFWTDSGRFLWTMDFYKTCFELMATIEPRVVLRTPQLAAKIQNVRYTTVKKVRDFDPASPYWVDGGISLRAAPATLSHVW